MLTMNDLDNSPVLDKLYVALQKEFKGSPISYTLFSNPDYIQVTFTSYIPVSFAQDIINSHCEDFKCNFATETCIPAHSTLSYMKILSITTLDPNKYKWWTETLDTLITAGYPIQNERLSLVFDKNGQPIDSENLANEIKEELIELLPQSQVNVIEMIGTYHLDIHNP